METMIRDFVVKILFELLLVMKKLDDDVTSGLHIAEEK